MINQDTISFLWALRELREKSKEGIKKGWQGFSVTQLPRGIATYNSLLQC